MQLNPNNFDWFIAGIDQDRLNGILGGTTNSAADMRGNGLDLLGGNDPAGAMKMEDTFLMVRGADDGAPAGLDNELGNPGL